jgi:C-terminal processing protease CtpA/Prc
MRELTPELARAFGLPHTAGGLVADITANSPAAHAGFAVGDVILSVNGEISGKKASSCLPLLRCPSGRWRRCRCGGSAAR